MTIRIGIMGYGNLGRGVECAIKQNPIWSLRQYLQEEIRKCQDPDRKRKVYHADEAKHMTDKIDV